MIDETIGGGELGDEFDNREMRVLQIFVEDEIFRVGSLADMNDQETTVVRNRAVKSPVGMISTLIDKDIGALSRAEAMKVELLKVVQPFFFFASGGGGESAIKKAMAVFRPRSTREFNPFYQVFALLAGGDFSDVPVFPIRPSSREAVGKHFSIIADRVTCE